MKDVQVSALNKAIKLLDAIGAEYIIAPQGEDRIVKGNLMAVERKRSKRKPSKHPFGTFTHLYRNVGVDKMEPGDVVSIPTNGFGKAEIQRSLGAFANGLWGRGNFTTHSNSKEVQIMRIA